MTTAVNAIQEAKTSKEILLCFPLLKILRPHIQENTFVSQVERQVTQGYHLIYIEDEDGIKCVAGYRFAEFLAWGKVLIVDDLITQPLARGIGFGTHLIKWLMREAKNKSCDGLHLDTRIDHVDAHRLYLNLDFKIDCLHLSMRFNESPPKEY